MDTIIEKAVLEVQSRYNCKNWKQRTKEFGAVLWFDESYCVTIGEIIEGNNNALNLYPQDIVKEINKFVCENTRENFFGEFHAHPSTVSIAGQLPSPDDLFRGSVIQDIWDDGKSLVTLHTPIIPPKIQLIILLQSGDVVVITPKPNRRKFTTIQEQRDALDSCSKKYNSFQRNPDSPYSFYPEQEEKQNGIEVVRRELKLRIDKINQIVGHRIQLELKKNEERG